ncbi:hypothetical protein FPRO05_05148, partial [Fusarium proliferatum]
TLKHQKSPITHPKKTIQVSLFFSSQLPPLKPLECRTPSKSVSIRPIKTPTSASSRRSASTTPTASRMSQTACCPSTWATAAPQVYCASRTRKARNPSPLPSVCTCTSPGLTSSLALRITSPVLSLCLSTMARLLIRPRGARLQRLSSRF